MEKIKIFLRPFYVPIVNYKNLSFYKNLELISNFFEDYLLFKKYSIVFSKKDIKNKEADLILHYHSLEKGMLFKKMKSGFAKHRIKNLHIMLRDLEIINNVHRDQIKTSYQVMCEYYELHQKENYDISDIYTDEQYNTYKNILNNFYSSDFSGKINWTRDSFYNDVRADFYNFAHSRKSVRDFTGEKIEITILQNVIDLANTAPSVCNRQASNVYLLEDKEKIEAVLKIQAGFAGYMDNVSQLLILTNDRKYYYTVGERNQFYIDGGAYLMNLLYALHYYKIGNCPANWGKTKSDDNLVRKIIDIPESEKIICMLPIGILKDDFRTTLSLRRNHSENFIIFK
ncbi:MAG: nitroreductase [Flavobacteriaceae bacterium CG18_big_fil_WC_8_21_14_2_50_34_36]|nr:nitroreductase family protein [Bacteroidota bacterium]PIQ16991.1 MAG: nitroreductase [Flavobacteriaceae bacterium CG18_big_fil_WC_8_21_14_2_50_34_36]PJC06330.1 MAG: nitroreductase [Flavobacteriaceae bacterium CG_4_9_14_0_8_um_filter_34_30]